MIGWYRRKLDKFLQLPRYLIILHITAKTVFCLGLGMLLAAYIESAPWALVGWIIIAVSILASIPSSIAILRPEKRRPESGGETQGE